MDKNPSESEVVLPGDYRSLLSKGGSKQAMTTLKGSDVLAKANRVIAMKTAGLRGAVLELVGQLEAAAQAADWPGAYDAAHEIRGMAGTVGLAATGRIANVLCNYLDALAELGLTPDAAIAGLHLDAILRSIRTEDDTARHGDAVAQQLSALVAHRLAEIRASRND